MKKNIHFLSIFILLTFCTLTIQAQTISDSWYGNGIVDLPNSSNNYLGELIINEKNKKITGVFSYYFRDSLFTNTIQGTYNEATRRLTLNRQNVIFHRTTNTKIGVDCPMYGEFTLRTSRIESVLGGVLFTDNEHQFTCPSINFMFKKGSDIVPVTKDLLVIKKNDSLIINSNKKIDEKQIVFTNRAKVYTQELEIESKSIRVEIYDNGQIDYDSVSLYLNDKLVLPKIMLKHIAITITLPLNDSLPFNELSMFAENVGLIPPNTAALIVYDGKTRHEIMMSSDLSRNATIKLIKKKKEE
ncbi:MAG: hypothetical protein H7101_13765 [Deinococcales bacterium]|nr:hypothetical protein [Chitinophagaceae bacterium]